MSLTVESVTKTSVGYYGTNMKSLVEAFMELYPDATLYQTVTNTTSKYEVYLKLGETGWYLYLYNSSSNFYRAFGRFVDGSFVATSSTTGTSILTNKAGYSLTVKKRSINGAITIFSFSSSYSTSSVTIMIATGKSEYDNKIYTLVDHVSFPNNSYFFGGDMTSPEACGLYNITQAYSPKTPPGATTLIPVYFYGGGGTYFGLLTFGNAPIYSATVYPSSTLVEFYCGSRRFIYLGNFTCIEIL